jgi:outer membrane protein assembly factor BamB
VKTQSRPCRQTPTEVTCARALIQNSPRAFWFGSTGGCNFTGAGIENICLSNLQPPPGIDSVPPEWAAFGLDWKPTWDETVAANPEEQWRRELSDGRALPPALQGYIATNSDAAGFVVGLRRITLLKAMLERFPDEAVKGLPAEPGGAFPEERTRYTETFKTLSQTSRQLILPWWPDPKASPFGKLNDFPRNSELTRRWESLVGAAKFHGPRQVINPEQIQAILNFFDQTDAYLEQSPSHHVSHPVALDRMLRSMSPEQLAPLRESQEKAVGFLAGELRRSAQPDEAIRLLRHAPWARSVHELLLDLGEKALLEGRPNWALASFEDVRNRAADPQMRLDARIGQWAALAQETGDRSALEHAMAAVRDDTPVPWHGEKIAAGDLKKKLLASTATAPLKLRDLDRNAIRLPAAWPADERRSDGPILDFGLHTPWPVSQVQADGDALFVFSPTRIARFQRGGGSPVWTHTPAETVTPPWDQAAADRYVRDAAQGTQFSRRPITPRSAHSSAISEDGRTIYCLVTSASPAAVALDAATGDRIWSSAAREDWRGFMPMSRPVSADGRVYVLTVPAGLGPNAGRGPGREPGPPVVWRLVCADGKDGRVLWTRTLGWQPYTLLDVARGSSGMTVRHGSVYCSTDMGLLARCDARDGAVDWVRGYASTANDDPRADNFTREGSCPLVAGNTVVIAPRDHSGVLAFQCDTGQFLWETIAVPSDRLVGVSRNAVLAMNEHRLCALDLGSGRTLWAREFPQGTGSQGAIVNGDAVVVSAGKLHRIAVTTGTTIETLDLSPPATAKPVLLPDGTLVEINPGS